MKNLLLPLFGLLFWTFSCTPKVAEVTQVEEPKTPVSMGEDDVPLSPCPNFLDAPNPDEAETNFVLYRDFMRARDWDQAYELWQKVYEVAPAADGRRNSVMADGISFYEYFMSQTTDSLERENYIDKIYEMYDRIDECYPEGGYVSGRKAFDFFYKYPERSTKMGTYKMFKESMDEDGMEDAQYFILNPMAALLVDQHFAGEIPLDEAQKYAKMIRGSLAEGLANCKGKQCDKWQIINEYVPKRFEAFESIKGFYDCEYIKNKYYQEFLDNKTDCEVVVDIYSRLKFAGCTEADAQFAEVIKVGNTNCAPEPTTKGTIATANQCLRDADYQCAIENYRKAADEETDIVKKGKYILLIAKIHERYLKNYPKARQYALESAEIDPNSGAPYMLIGRMYASSGPLCGPGRGWDSQIVVWPAIDMWRKAKSVDSSVAAEANKFIGRYTQYMPSKGDIFQRNLTEGSSFKVGCWIQRSTTIRAAPN